MGLCAIIRACHKSNVSRLKFGDVEVTFGPEPIVDSVSRETAAPQNFLGGGDVSMELASDQRAIMEDAADTEMMIMHPDIWEQQNIDRIVHQNRSMDG